jgi:hypothetical protein
VAVYCFLDPRGLYETLNEIEAFAAIGDWDSAAAGASRTRDEAQHQQSVASTNKHEWRDFMIHADYLHLTIRAHDREGCIGELAVLHSALDVIGGPYRKWGCNPCGYHWLGKVPKLLMPENRKG